jgi:hypothetical protein
MLDDLRLQKAQLDEIRRGRAYLVEQIRNSQKTIERSQELLRRIDQLLAKAEQKLEAASIGGLVFFVGDTGSRVVASEIRCSIVPEIFDA